MMKKHQWAYERLGWTDLTPESKKIFESTELDLMPILREFRVLAEAEMTNAQITGLFKGAEDISREKGHRTMFGKAAKLPVDAAKKVNSFLDKWVVNTLKNSKTLENWEPKYKDLKQKYREKFGKNKAGQKILAMVDALGGIMESRPIVQAAVIALMTTLLVGSGGLGLLGTVGVVTILTGATEAIKGSDLGTIAGKAVKAGVLGLISGAVFQALSSWFSHLRIDSISVGPEQAGIEKISFSGRETVHSILGDRINSFRISDAMVTPTEAGAIRDAVLRVATGDPTAYNTLLDIARKISSPEHADMLKNLVGETLAKTVSNDGFLKSIQTIGSIVKGAAAAGAAAGAGNIDRKEPTAESTKLSLPIMEGLWADLTLEFGAGKLMKAWNQAGRPTDSVEIAQMLARMGMDDDDMRDAFKRAGLDDTDIESTMVAVASGEDDDIDLPFITGDGDIDREAKRILKTKGEDELKKFYQEKLAALKAQVASEEKPTGDATSTDDTITKMRELSKEKNVDGMKSLIGNLASMDAATKKRLLGFVTQAEITDDEKKAIADLINKATVAEMSLFEEISNVLRASNMSWKDLGYRYVIKERRSNSVILV
jgi:hypothetical protein